MLPAGRSINIVQETRWLRFELSPLLSNFNYRPIFNGIHRFRPSPGTHYYAKGYDATRVFSADNISGPASAQTFRGDGDVGGMSSEFCFNEQLAQPFIAAGIFGLIPALLQGTVRAAVSDGADGAGPGTTAVLVSRKSRRRPHSRIRGM